ncbi:MAG TPA: C39 family peptidase [Methylomirabilota bacterium]
MTDLFVVASGLEPASVMAAVPPSCRREIDAPPPGTADGRDIVLAFPEWRPRRPALHLLPSFSMLTPAPPAFRFEVAIETAGGWSPWVATETIGEASFSPLPGAVDGLRCDVDVFAAARPAERVRLRLRLPVPAAATVTGAPWLVTLSAAGEHQRDDGARIGSARIQVPGLSQMEAPDAIRARICSPTCLTMVARYWGVAADVDAVASAVFHPRLDMYGVWPAAIRAAGALGIGGYLLRVPDWATAAWCLDHGLPLIVSVRYTSGELTGAAIAKTDGHLLVVTGYEGDTVIVNDPAAGTRREVERRYRLDELRRVWLERTGVAYILFRPAPAGSGARGRRR